MMKLILVIFFAWVFNSYAHIESAPFFVAKSNVVVTSQDTPVNHSEIPGAEVKSGERPWRRPDFSNQKSALGYSGDVFQVPRGMEKVVKFWTDIYTKYSTSQGVIHDSEVIDLVYEVVDFSSIEKMEGVAEIVKERMKKKLVNDAKERASAILSKLESNVSLLNLSAEERRVWEHFRNVPSVNKFKEANNKDRIRFQLGQSDRMKSAIFFSGRYLEDFEQIFKEENLPIELTRLVFVESSFNVLARSKVGASGLWQIMPSVARPQKMMSNYVDRRNDPWDATRLAARVLAGNYRMLGKWPLAITGYNHGPNGVRRIVERYGSSEISELVSVQRTQRTFGFASRNFYASFLAALEVEKNAKIYFPDIKWSEKLKSVSHKTASAMSYGELLRLFDSDRRQAEIFNPHLTYRVKDLGAAIPAGTKIYVPADKIALLLKRGSGRSVAADDQVFKSSEKQQ